MFKKILTSLIAAPAIALMFASMAQATIIDVVSQHQKVSNSSFSYQHNINDDGFVLGSALSGSLSINIFDDRDLAGEIATIVVEDLDFDTGGLWGTLLFSAAPGWANELGLEALFAINSNGFLDVSISGWGDFWVGDSTLTVETRDVPEPSSIMLLALGLLAVGISRRRLNRES